MGVPPMITGGVAGADEGLETFVIHYAEGRALTAADEGTNVTVLGSDIARKYDKHVGDTLVLKGEPFTVVGVLEPTLTAPDQTAAVPMAAAQRLLVATLPPDVPVAARPRRTSRPRWWSTPTPGIGRRGAGGPHRGAGARRGDDDRRGLRPPDRIGDVDPQLDPGRHRAHQPHRRRPVGHQHDGHVDRRADARDRRQAGHRRRPVAHRPRAGRPSRRSSASSAGSSGWSWARSWCSSANEAGRSSGTVLFELTAGTAITAIAFGTVLGALAGFVPALHAARLDPVAALRHE